MSRGLGDVYKRQYIYSKENACNIAKLTVNVPVDFAILQIPFIIL